MPSAIPRKTTPDELRELKAEYLIPCVYHFYQNPPHIVAAEGCFLIDHTGRRYLDCYSGVTVMNAGHCNAAITEPAIEQIRTLQHTTTIYLTEPMLRLAKTLAEITPGRLKRSFFCVSGSEAVEGALLLASLHTKRDSIIAMNDSLHGRTRFAMSATGLDMWRTDPFPLDGIHHIPFGDADAVREAFRSHGDRIGALIAEPIQGNGGIRIPDTDYWPAVQRLCQENGALLIFDEVQTGFNRTGRWFACEHWNVTPDVLVVSKAMGNGFPIAAFITTDEIATAYTRPGASTFGGNPVASAAARATIEFHKQQNLTQASAQLGEFFLTKLEAVADKFDCLCGARGKGLMAAVDLIDSARQPDPARLGATLEYLKDHGFLCGKTGSQRNTLTFMPPLTIQREQLDELLKMLAAALNATEAAQ